MSLIFKNYNLFKNLFVLVSKAIAEFQWNAFFLAGNCESFRKTLLSREILVFVHLEMALSLPRKPNILKNI